MNKKGFTLIELLAVIILLGLVGTIAVFSVSRIFNSTKEKSEEAFVATIKDAMEVYLSGSNPSNAYGSKLTFSNATDAYGRRCYLSKSHDPMVYVEVATTTFESVIKSEYKPITAKDLVNPANEGVACITSASVTIYRDEDYVYYYKINKSDFGCLTTTGTIDNLPEGFSCR